MNNPERHARAKEKAKNTCEQKKRAIKLVEGSKDRQSGNELDRSVTLTVIVTMYPWISDVYLKMYDILTTSKGI